ncbi:MAG: aromatic ring hydroxylase, partial [Dehalococcoidia bacterium]|nr:aromatic ring hydroxylase [Dehalococcoidia bacterium]
MRISQEYRDKLFKMKHNVYIDGELVGRDDPRMAPGINVVSQTYDLAQDSQYDGIMTTTSHLSGEKI